MKTIDGYTEQTSTITKPERAWLKISTMTYATAMGITGPARAVVMGVMHNKASAKTTIIGANLVRRFCAHFEVSYDDLLAVIG